VAFRRMLYMTTYKDPSGKVEERHQFIERILQPGETLPVAVSDMFVKDGVTGTSVRIAGADALQPIE